MGIQSLFFFFKGYIFTKPICVDLVCSNPEILHYVTQKLLNKTLFYCSLHIEFSVWAHCLGYFGIKYIQFVQYTSFCSSVLWTKSISSLLQTEKLKIWESRRHSNYSSNQNKKMRKAKVKCNSFFLTTIKIKAQFKTLPLVYITLIHYHLFSLEFCLIRIRIRFDQCI